MIVMKSQPKWVLLGADTLAGREIRDLIEDRKLPVRLRACGSAADQRVLSLASEDNFDVLEELNAELLADADAVFLAGRPDQATLAVQISKDAKASPVFIDLAGHFDSDPKSSVRAPAFERQPAPVTPAKRHIVAHPAAIALATVLDAIHAASPVRNSVATIFEPASARGSEGVGELHQQTLHIFAFQSLPTKVFGTQASFNILPRLGPEAPIQLEPGEARIRLHLRQLLSPRKVPVPSLRLVHAPAFNGYCASLWIDFKSRPDADLIQKQLSAAGVEFWSAGDGPLTNSSLAGQSGTLVSNIQHDPDNPRAAWLWLACDNIRETALNAVALAGLSARKA
jgi:aspartate-semialdehyde dehydrogenase